MSNEFGNGSRIQAAIQAYELGVQMDIPANELAKPMGVLFGEPGQQVVEALDGKTVDDIICVVWEGFIARRDQGNILPLNDDGVIDPKLITQLQELHSKYHSYSKGQVGSIFSEVIQDGTGNVMVHMMPAIGYDSRFYPFIDEVQIQFDGSRKGPQWVVTRQDALLKGATAGVAINDGASSREEVLAKLAELQPQECGAYASLEGAVKGGIAKLAEKHGRMNRMGVPTQKTAEATEAINSIYPLPEDMLSDDRLLALATKFVNTTLPCLWDLDRMIKGKSL